MGHRDRIAERNERIIALSRQHVTAPNIAKRTGIPLKTVQRIRKENGLSTQRRIWTPEREAQALRLLADGVIYAEVDRTLNLPRNSTIHKFPGQGPDREGSILLRNDTGLRERERVVIPDAMEPYMRPTPVEGPPE